MRQVIFSFFASFSLLVGACSLDGSLFGGLGDPCNNPRNLILCDNPDEDPNDPTDCNVDTNNDGVIDENDCNTDPGDPTDPCDPVDPCEPNADGSLPPNCNPDPGCDPATGANCGCDVDTNNDGIIDNSDCYPVDPCINADGTVDPNCANPGDPCSPNADGSIPPNCPNPGCDPATGANCGCNVDTNNDGIIDGSDCPSDPCAPNTDGSVSPGCDPADPCAPDANAPVGPNCPDPTDPGGCGVDTNNDGVIDGDDCQNTDPCNNPNGGC